MTKKNKKGENTVNNEVNIDKIIKVKKEEVELIPEVQTEKPDHEEEKVEEKIFLYKNNKLVSDNNDVKVIIGDETESYIDKIKADLERRTQERCIALGF